MTGQELVDYCNQWNSNDQNECRSCYLYSDNICGWCDAQTADSPWQGCWPKGARDLPINSSVCSWERDNWIGSARDCYDACDSRYNGGCNECLEDNLCGFCADGAGCTKGDSDGPWWLNMTSGKPSYCSDWRYIDGIFSVDRLCNSQVPCADVQNCEDCSNNWSAFNTTCHWCTTSADGRLGKCTDTGSACPTGTTGLTLTQCPGDYNGSSLLFISFSLLIASLLIM
eukprot:TRINITY_DN19326_c0_g1_i1.p1 TRINITY_DN19326_c0_g1~~TRINITY_DN19326_c0_g1_i1.p1  ORF type:complete len:266 (-),score=31.03 TRINITY_DN19326_c0_g1_i1:44-724(-)